MDADRSINKPDYEVRLQCVRCLRSLFLACALLTLFPLIAKAADNMELDPGRYTVSGFPRATNLRLNKSGTYTLYGSANNVMVYVGERGGDITLVLENLDLRPDQSAPGLPTVSRSAISVGNVRGSTVRIVAKSGTRSVVIGYSNSPAICKNGKDTALIFEDGGTLVAMADPMGFRIAAIGSDETESADGHVRRRYFFGNVTFNDITVQAFGSSAPNHLYGRGGPGIGASFGGYVDGITFNDGCDITAVAGSPDSAAIGTVSGDCLPVLPWGPLVQRLDFKCTNITINGGNIVCQYTNHTNEASFGAAIGGGEFCSANGIVINGGNVYVSGSQYQNTTLWATGIGAGSEATAKKSTSTEERLM